MSTDRYLPSSMGLQNGLNSRLAALSGSQIKATGFAGGYLLGGVKFSRFSYGGGDYAWNVDASMSLYASRANNVWDQYYLTASKSIGSPAAVRWTGG
jgi:outer membrane porin, OprD family